MELTDLEICKRIAKINGETVLSEDDWFYPDSGCLIEDEDRCSQEYNPLTDKALCFDLMVKYEVDLQAPYRPHNETEWEVNYWVDGVSDSGVIRCKNPQRAICLAVIAMHNGGLLK